MKHKQLNVDFRYLGGNIACLSVSSVNGEVVENDINNEEAIIIFNSLVGEKKNCVTVKMLQQENEQLKKQLENKNNPQIFIDTEDMEERYGTDLYIEYLEKENKQKDEIIDEILSYGIFEGDCPCSISGEELDCCENCQDDYKKCWLKYFKEKIQRDN